MELDDRLSLASAEGIDLHLALAGIGSRSAAFLLDLLVQALLLFLVGLVGSAFDGLGLAFFSIATFLVLLGYPILLEGFASGQTLGKRALGIAVVAADGTPATFLNAVVRNLVRVVDALPGVYFVGIVAVLVTERSQRVGDLAAGTLVVYREQPLARPQVPQAAALRLPFALDLSEQRAILGFAERQGELSVERVHELASILATPLQVSPARAVEQLNGVARGLLGPT